jgi:Nucleoside-diphosphate-sugar epimerases
MLAALTGATGLVGSNLAVELRTLGHTVRCTRRSTSSIDHLSDVDVDWVEADVRDSASLDAAFTGADVVFHCAGVIEMRPKVTRVMHEINIEGTENVVRAVRRVGVKRLVHCSSATTTALARGMDTITEDDPWNPPGFADGYTVSKRRAEEHVLASCHEVDAVIVVPTCMLGPRDPKPSSGRLILQVASGRAIASPTGDNNFVDVRDVCRGMIAAWQKGTRGSRYILGHENLSYNEIMTRIARVAGVDAPRRAIPRWIAAAAGRAGDFVQSVTGREAILNSVTVRQSSRRGNRFSSEKARRELGYTTGSLDAAIEDAIEWFRGRGML